MVGAIGSYFDLGSVSEGIPEPRGAGEEICHVAVPSVREGESVDIEVDSRAELSSLPLLETKLSMCGSHHVAAGGGKLHELGARILGLKAGAVQGNDVNLLMRFRGMDIGNTRSSPLWLETDSPC